MVPGWAVLEATASVRAVLVPQLLLAVTDTLPVVNPEGKVTEIEVVPSPPLMTALAGTVQLYEVAPVVEAEQV